MQTPPQAPDAPIALGPDALDAALHVARDTASAQALVQLLDVGLRRPADVGLAQDQPTDTETRRTLAALLCPAPPLLDGPGLWRLVRAARVSAAPHTSLVRMLRLAEGLGVPPWRWAAPGRQALASVMGGSDAASRMLLGEPSFTAELFAGADITQSCTAETMRDALRRIRAAHPDTEALEMAVRRYRNWAWVRIVGRALSGLGDVETTLRELSCLADAVVDILTRHHLRRERSRRGMLVPWGAGRAGFAVLAQGKLGGRELNLSSDIDLQFVCDAPAELDLTSSELHARLSAVAQRLVRGLSHNDAAGQGYRVDLDLRPEGKKGALIHSVSAMETYYATWGAAWERLALIRARHIAGAPWVSAALLQAVHTFIYPRHVAGDTLASVRHVAVRIAQERRQNALAKGQKPGHDIKRDRGGIRDVELFVQTLQHLHGGKHPSVQTPSLYAALSALELLGVFASKTAQALREAYRFLRATENCLQATEQRQTHRLPETPAGMAHLAGQMRQMGGAKALQADIDRYRRVIMRLTQALFVIPRARAERVGTSLASQALVATGPHQAQLLVQMGFGDGVWAQGMLAVLAQGRGGAFCRDTHSAHAGLGPALLRAMAQSPDPAQALGLFVNLDALLRRAQGYFALLAQAPKLRHRLMELLGTSAFLSRTLVQFPDLVDWLAQTPDLTALRLPADAAGYAVRLAPRMALSAGDVGEQLRAVCRFKLREQLRLGLLDKAQAVSVARLTQGLSALAEACVQAVLQLSERRLDAAALGLPSYASGFSIIALGRLGAMEMGYGSDVDLVFVWREDVRPAAAPKAVQAAHALKLAQGCIAQLTARNLEGALYAIDTRLRPSGNQGPLVTSLAGFVDYYAERAMLWECQALLRGRAVAGDIAMGQAVLDACAQRRYPPTFDRAALSEMHRMRMRMAEERARPKPAMARVHPQSVDIKVGPGGLADVEFAVQALQMRYAHKHPSLRVTHTATAIEALGALGLLSPQRSQRSLEAYWYLRKLENAMRIVHDKPASQLALHGPRARALARRMGLGHLAQPIKALGRDWQRMARRAQRLYAHVFAAVLDAAAPTAAQPLPVDTSRR